MHMIMFPRIHLMTDIMIDVIIHLKINFCTSDENENVTG